MLQVEAVILNSKWIFLHSLDDQHADSHVHWGDDLITCLF